VSLLDDASFFFALFKKSIDNLIKNHHVIHDVLALTQTDHENGVDGTTKVAVRAYNCYRILALNLTSRITRLRYFPHSYDLNRAITYAQNSDLSLIGSDIKDIQTAMGHVGGERYALEQELHLSFKRERDPGRVAASLEQKREHQDELERARAQALARDQAAALAESLGATFVRVNTTAYPIQLKADVQISNLLLIAQLLTATIWEREINSLLRLKLLMEKVVKLLLEADYSIAASELKELATILNDPNRPELRAFKELLLNSLKQVRSSPEFELTKEQSETLSKYFAANRLFVECLRLAVIPNRQFTEESLLQLPR
jgi:hypothetical protein